MRARTGMITPEEATRFASEWVEAWNSHDLTRILAHYSEDFVMSSPRITQIAGEPSGTLRGKRAVASYWTQALSMLPDLQFRLRATFLGADSLAIHYEGTSGPVVEVFFFDETGLVRRAAAHYSNGLFAGDFPAPSSSMLEA